MSFRVLLLLVVLGSSIANKVIHHTTDKKSSGSVDCIQKDSEVPDCDHYDRLKFAIQSAKAKIWAFWKIHKFPKFLTMMHIPTKSWDIQKAKFMNLILNKPKNGVNQTYVAGFSGSSVTAGHDNYFYEAYPNVFYEAMLPVMNSIGQVDFRVMNHALGNNPCYPYAVCLETHFGSDLDLLTWEQSMNCGRGGKNLDTFTRQANMMPKKPTVMYLESTAPEWHADECERKNITASTPRPPESLEEKKLLHQMKLGNYKVIANNTRIMYRLQEYLIDEEHNEPWGVHPGDMVNPLRYIHDRFSHLAPMGMEFRVTEDYKCYGPYGPHFCEKTPGGGGGWHPGKLQHKLRGESLAFGLLHIMEDAVQSIQDSICTLSGDTRHLDSNLMPSDIAGKKAEEQKHHHHHHSRRLGEAPKDLFVPSSRESALQLMHSKSRHSSGSSSSKKESGAAVDSPQPAAGEEPKKGKKEIFHLKADGKHKSPGMQHEEAKAMLAKLVASRKTKAGGGGGGAAAAAGVTESVFVSLTNHTNFRQSALEILSHDHATEHHVAAAAVTAASAIASTAAAGGGVSSSALVKKPVHIPDSVIEMTGLPPLPHQQVFKLSSESGSECHFTPADHSADDKAKMNHLKAATLMSAQQYSRFYLQSVQGVKVMPVPASYQHNETADKPSCFTDYEPRAMRDMTLTSRIIPKYSNWNLSLSFFDVNAVHKAEARGLGYLDRKMLWSSEGKGSQIAVKIHNNALNFVWICQCQKGFLTYPGYMGDLIPAAEFFVLLNEQDLDKVSSGKPAVGTDNSVMLEMNKFSKFDVEVFGPMCFRPLVKFPPGDHVLVIRQKEEDKKVNIGYVVTF